jgi:hypothetical protein
MEALLASLRQGFDVVIVDTPPLFPVTDGAVAATNRRRRTVLVFRCGKTTTAQVAFGRVTRWRGRRRAVLGCVLKHGAAQEQRRVHVLRLRSRARRGPAGPRPPSRSQGNGKGADVHSWATVPTGNLSVVYQGGAARPAGSGSPVPERRHDAASTRRAGQSSVPVSSAPSRRRPFRRRAHASQRL